MLAKKKKKKTQKKVPSPGSVFLVSADATFVKYVLVISNSVVVNDIVAVVMAVRALQAKEVQRIILTRPAVEAGERLGFLPGDLMAKIDPYLRPLYDALYEMLGFETVNKYIERNIIEVAPLAFMRGRTLNNSFIILVPRHSAPMHYITPTTHAYNEQIHLGRILQELVPRDCPMHPLSSQHDIPDITICHKIRSQGSLDKHQSKTTRT